MPLSVMKSGRLLSTGMMPIILALRMALPILRWFFHVSFVSLRPRILPIFVTKRERSDVLRHSLSGSRFIW